MARVLLALLFGAYVLFLYGPTAVIVLLAFGGPDGGLTFPMRGTTLHWFAHPQWFQDLGEFQKEENIQLFVDWAKTAFKLFGMCN